MSTQNNFIPWEMYIDLLNALRYTPLKQKRKKYSFNKNLSLILFMVILFYDSYKIILFYIPEVYFNFLLYYCTGYFDKIQKYVSL